MKSKSLTALTVSLLLAVSVLGGCGNSDAKSVTADNTASAAVSEDLAAGENLLADSADIVIADSAFADQEPLEKILPDELCRTYTFSNSEEMWFCSLDMNTDGSFFGTYERFEQAEEGKSYVTVIHMAQFSGQFTDITDETDHSRTMILRMLTSENGEEYEMDHILYTPVELKDVPLAAGDTFTLALPDSSKSSAPDGLEKAAGDMWNADGDTLGFYALYNQQGNAFYTSGTDEYNEAMLNAEE